MKSDVVTSWQRYLLNPKSRFELLNNFGVCNAAPHRTCRSPEVTHWGWVL